MTDNQKSQIRTLREGGIGYLKIAKMLGLSVNTVRSFCHRNNVEANEIHLNVSEDDIHFCKCCGQSVAQNPKRKEKIFCSDECRRKWWSTHPDELNRKAIYEFTCQNCKKQFTSYGNSKRKYCSNACYVADRFGGEKQ